MIIGPEHNSPAAPLRPLFSLGRLLITPAARDLLLGFGVSPGALVERHSSGDWGDIDREDWRLNDIALAEGTRIFSAYVLPVIGERVWVITEWDRSYTTILLPNDY